MARKDSEKRREYHREWRKKNKEYRIDYFRNRYIKKHPNVKRRFSGYYDFETHRELAMSSGIQSQREWVECSKLRLLPDGIHSHPEKAFRRK